MKIDTLKAGGTLIFAFLVLGMAFYGLVLYPFALDPLVQGALIGWGSAAMAFMFGQEIAKASTAAAQRAYDKGVATPAPNTITGAGMPNTISTTTVDPGPPATTTTVVEPTEGLG